jgi:hypothetical protein
MADRAFPCCPIYGKTGNSDYTPFCSQRCADVDLGRWLTGTYRLPDAGSDTEQDAGTPTAHREPA